MPLQVYNLLGESGVSFFATPEPAARYRRGFPRSLNGAPLLRPADHAQTVQ
jgi:LysR family transcriptional activator of nhaA